MKLKDKVAIVTGSSMGIGRAIARRLGEEGATVVLNGRDTVKLARTHFQLSESGIKVDSFPADISSPEDCRQLIAHTLRMYGRIDILINNAGISSKGFFEDTHPEIFQQVVDVNLLGSLYATREALPHIKASKGHILFISSLAGLRGIPFQCPYCLSKMAQTALAESLRAELYQKGTHVGIIYVGITKNDPEKRIIFSDGSWKSLPERNHPFAATQDRVAKAVVRAMDRKQFKTVVEWSGKVYYLVSRFVPWLLDYTFRNNLDSIKKLDTKKSPLSYHDTLV